MIQRNLILLLLFLCTSTSMVFAQRTISGKVIDTAGETLIGVNILEAGTSNGTVTDFDGNYSLAVSDGATLLYSYTGYADQSIVVGAQSMINLTLEEGVALDEVVVTALGISREKKSLTYAAQNVKTEELTQARSLNVVNGLSGKVAGLSVTTSGQGVGGASKVLLRGNRSISGSSQPLYVVDGVILNGDISNLSPDDIEEISVLKGANAAALYGSRANNGAIIVTTKSGKGAKDGVTTNFGLNYQVSDPNFLLKYQNEYGQGSEGTYAPAAVTSWGPRMDGQQVDHWSNDPNYLQGTTYAFSPQPNNITDFLQTGYSASANLSVNIKKENTNTFMSYTYTDAEGIISGNDLSRHNLSLRVNTDLSSKLSMDAKVNYIREDFGNKLQQGENYDNPYRYGYLTPRNIRTEDIAHYEFINAEGKNTQHHWIPQFNGAGNPYWVRENVLNPVLEERVTGLVSLKYQITDDLSIMGRSALDRQNGYSEFSRKNDTYTRARFGSYEKNFSYGSEWNSDVLVNFNKDLSKDFKLDFNVGANLRKFKQDRLIGTGADFQVENLFALSNTAEPRPREGELAGISDFKEKEVQSVYSFAQFGYLNAIYLNVSARNDWSSTLPRENRSYFYPSVGLTAVVSELVNLPDFFTFLKLRGSWAEVGNDTEPYQLSRQATVNAGTITLGPKLPVADLRPETTQSTEIGFDTRFLENKFRLDFTWYKSNTFDQIFETPVPRASGFSSVFQNGADVENTGIEIQLGASIISTSDFSWDIGLNFAKNNSEVLKIAEGFTQLDQNTDFIRTYRLEVGQPFGNVYSRGFQRDAQGRVIVGADGIPLITSGLDVLISNFNPDWLGGINNSFNYKDFSLSFLIDIRQGGTSASFTEAILAGNGLLDYTADGRDGSLVFGQNVFSGETAVKEDGSANDISVSSEDLWNTVGGRNTPVGEAFIRDASNIRLRELVLGYSFPQRITSNLPFASARVSFVARNLFFFSNKAEYFDPEVTSGISNNAEGREAFAPPTTRSFGLNLNFGF